jgi:hypothetical protein
LNPHENRVDVYTPVKILFRGGGKFNVMMIMMMIIIMMMMIMIMIMILIMMIMTIESVEQRPGLGEHVLKIALILKMDENGRIQGIQTIQYTHIASYCSYTNGG